MPNRMDAKSKKRGEPPLPERVGDYAVQKRIGRGGMGEVYLGLDPLTKRPVVIKQIRSDLKHHKIVRDRFLNEAKIAASLFHPSIIPVYSIHQTGEDLYYTMPYVEGKTLKQILRETIEKEKELPVSRQPELSLSTLIRIFLNVCQAVAYCHAKGVLHRDLKPENILVGGYGEVYILDWGLAAFLFDNKQDHALSKIPLPPDVQKNLNLTRPGKVFGTLPYLPPERMSGKPATILSEVYSLGVILYQLLTLRMPFHRRSIQEYQKYGKYETPLDILEVAGFRDIPPRLAAIAKQCLDKDPAARYGSVEDLIGDLERYQEGVPDWVYKKSLSLNENADWQLQENVLLSKLISITRSTEIMEWVYIMISRDVFSGNKKLTADLSLSESSLGIGFLLNVPESPERKSLEEGYCLWLGSEKNPGVKLTRENVPICDLSDYRLPKNQNVRITIEKMDHNIKLFVDGDLILDHYDHLPIIGSHVGILCRDMDFTLKHITVYEGSHSAMVGCLSIPDAFLASKDFDRAITEYTRIAHSFSGRTEGRDATFRAGITLIEQAKTAKQPPLKEALLSQAFECFNELHSPAASGPFETLGKSLVYREQGNLDEEIKTLELGIRRYQKHPLRHLLEDHINFRLHESAKNDRKGVYNFALITLRHIPGLFANRDTHALIHNLTMHFEPLYFFDKKVRFRDLKERYFLLAVELAFWLNKPVILKEMHEEATSSFFRDLICFALLQLGCKRPSFGPIEELIQSLPDKASSRHFWPLLYKCERTINRQTASRLLPHIMKIKEMAPTENLKKAFQFHEISTLLLSKQTDQAEAILQQIPEPEMKNPESPFFFLKGCFLATKEGASSALKHFHIKNNYVFPPISALLANYLHGTITLKPGGWLDNAFFWEEVCLYRQVAFYYHCLNRSSKAFYYEKRLRKMGFLR